MSEITRTVTVFDQNTQEKTVIENVTATTFGELKGVLASKGIYTDGMDVREGISRVDLKSDSAVLPHDTPYRGGVTNDLMILLTKTNKKVSSGIGRSEAVEYIKANNLGDAVKAATGKNWTNVSTPELVAFVEKAIKGEAPAEKAETPCQCSENLVKAIRVLVENLYEDGYLSSVAYDKITGLLSKESVSCKEDEKGFSQDEIYAALREM